MKIIDYARQTRIIQIVLFGIMGGLSTLADTLITTMSYRFTKDLALSVLLGYISSLLIGYILHKKVTFKSKRMNKSSLKRYAIAAVVGYFVSLFIVRAFMYALRADDAFFPKILSIPFVALFSFLLGKFWVFREEPEYALK
ncbi:MAG: GtrA family protein [Methylococcales bacterium]|nr:GtrA family protein [Methylococcales bacterium]